MGNTPGGEEESLSAGPVCRDMSAYQLSLHDGRGEGKKQKDYYVCLNGEIFDVTKDKEEIEKEFSSKASVEAEVVEGSEEIEGVEKAVKFHRGHPIGKNESEVTEEEVAYYKENYKLLGNLIETKEFTLDQIKPFNGVDNDKIYLSARGLVFDVTLGVDFYGPDRGYHIFAGRNAQRALALVSLKIEDVENTSLEDVDSTGQGTLDDWIDKYHSKYIHIGYLKEENGKKEEDGIKTTTSGTAKEQ
mmetsp:Transcript_13425/g.15740  ORF Transcript_13425/g.15740 Transcript_13425/m.15740 type:complete len:245 (+) Transcript_13425:446-1180(+)